MAAGKMVFYGVKKEKLTLPNLLNLCSKHFVKLSTQIKKKLYFEKSNGTI